MAGGSLKIRCAPALAALVACLLALAGCGSSASSSSSSAASSSSSASATTASSTTSASTTTSSSTSQSGDLDGKLDQLPKSPESKTSAPAQPTGPAGDRPYLQKVFNDVQNFWHDEFAKVHITYRPARLVFFNRTTHSGCGAQQDTGPFYCGADHTVYLDLNFFGLLVNQAGVGPFGLAYIVGHEVGHHVQNLLGISQRVATANQQNPSGQNALSVRTELQADCLAGVWAHSFYKRGQVTDDDLQHALKTAAIVGDDFQQSAAGREPDQSLWTHGSSQQRQHWLTAGFEKATPNACDTFTSSDA